jgi:hypothetical protein
MGLLTSLHYDFVVDAADSLATVVRLELADERFDFYTYRFFFFFSLEF